MDPMNSQTPTPNPVPGPVPGSAPVPPVAPVTPPVAPIEPPVVPATPVNPVFTPTGGGLVNATDPITMPAPPKAPDPIEEELNAPFKAAEPVPGSIGSAISVPPSNQPAMNNPGSTPSVAFNDPATMTQTSPQGQATKKKMSKRDVILLSVVAGVIVIVLAIILVMQITTGK